MDPMMLAGLGTQIAGSGMRMGLGIYQMIKANQMDPQRPKYEIPQEIYQQLGLSQANLNGRMAGATQAEQNIQANYGNAMGGLQRSTTDASQLLMANAVAQNRANQAAVGLGAAEANDRQRRINELQRSQMTMAQYRDRAFDLNKMQPYQDEARTKAALMEGGLKNTFGAVQGAGQTLGQYYMYENSPYGGQYGMQGQPQQGYSRPQGFIPSFMNPGTFF